MAFIVEFTIEGLAGRVDAVHQVLDRHVNIFWGLNGSGKTSLLKILNSALKNDAALLQRVPFRTAQVIFESTDNQVRYTRRITNELHLNAENEEFVGAETSLEPMGEGVWREITREPSKNWITTSESKFAVSHLDSSFKHTYLPISRMTQTYALRPQVQSGPLRRSTIDDAYLDEEFAEQVERKWQIYNGQALSTIRTIQQQGLASILALLFGGGSELGSAVSEEVIAKEAHVLVRDFLSQQGLVLQLNEPQFVTKYENNPDLRNVVAEIQAVTSEVQVAIQPQQEFQDVVQSLYSGDKKLFFDRAGTGRASLHIEQNGIRIPLQALSSGEKQLLRLMLETLAAEDSTVMIDEPELSMHVDWQQILVAAMRRINPACQLLLATHSPEVMADVPDEFVFEL